ncbi:DNA segregation ATPase FtsK SpoIIIE related protein [Secundilactobacillus odoratitofui DSM 19909 = JCM 15043]|uniref:DNA translocase FtsK n=1 Tax=Secundilactobacillus odoratitofui DSM 19909 = JCM 15043 TaxID=1423776 RepID=A0A0R1LPZ1_9LACO|nr:DNA translocase FtsK [Secundilactobacillus odoratitofui]KRK97910.1 DNA segregation ATPase FtsK SpoIIIE related protein [Secundilactobacillus odoratitofui DSM 19909 = JCM 15043]
MKHYDGPAFFRKYRQPKSADNQPQLNESKAAEVPFNQRREQRQLSQPTRHTQLPKRPQSAVKPNSKPNPHRVLPTKNDWQSSAPFRPSAVPTQLKRHQPAVKINFQRLIERYFQKPDRDVLITTQQPEDETTSVLSNTQNDQAPVSTTLDTPSVASDDLTDSQQNSQLESLPSKTATTNVIKHPESQETSQSEQAFATKESDKVAQSVSKATVIPDEPTSPVASVDSESTQLTENDQSESGTQSDQPQFDATQVTDEQPVTNSPEPAPVIDVSGDHQHSELAGDSEEPLEVPEDPSEVAETTEQADFVHESSQHSTTQSNDQIEGESVSYSDEVDSDQIKTDSAPVVTASDRLTPRFDKPVKNTVVPDERTEKNQETVSTATVTTTQPQSDHGLGHSLGDILSEENTSSQLNELALFHDKPDAVSTQVERGYQFPSTDLLTPPVIPDENELDEWIEHQGEVLDETLQAFHVDAHVVDWTIGPTVTQFQVHLSLGVKVNKITNLTDDLKLALAAKDIRIEAPIPGKTTVGIEIPNPKTRPVMLSEVLESKAFTNSKSPLTVALGVDLFGQPQVTDLRKMPHGLIAGATGSGKSVFINSLLISLLYKATPAQLRLLLIDPKAVELAPYDQLPHLLSPVISDPKAAAAALKWAVTEMDDRYERLAAAGVRNIEQYNERAELTEEYGLKLPYIVIVIDELADLMMMASSEVQDYIVRITQKARAAGIHLLIATQRPSVDIVTGTIKNNIPTRVAFMVSSQVDSRTIIDTSGAERLLGKGDMLFLGNGASQPLRLQGTFVDDEVDRITDFVRTQGKPHYAFDPDGLLEKQQVQDNQDELMPEVLDYIVQEKTVSTSKLQRVFSIGYNRAANLIDTLENKQYISAQNGSKPRDVFLTEKQLAEMRAPRTD